MFDAIPYLSWMHARHGAVTYDLGSSDLRAPDDEAPGPAAVRDLPGPPAGETLETQLAAEYGVDEDQVLVTAGASHANLLVAAAVAGGEPGVEPRPQVLVEKPGYQPLVETPAALGLRVDRFLRRSDAAYRLLPERLAGAASDAFVLATVTNRHNPTGRLTDRETLEALAEVARAHDGHLLVDEVYAPFVTDPDPEDPFGGPTAVGLPNTVVTGSLTKFFGLGTLGIGWLVGPTDVVARARDAASHFPFAARTSRDFARRALANADDLAEAQRTRLRENHDLLSSFLTERPDLGGEVFAGSTFGLLAHETLDGDALVDAALERDLLLVPGRFFGRPESVRISLGRDTETMRAGLDVLAGVLDDR